MNNSTLFKKAHALTKEIICAGDDYRVTFGACVKHLISQSKATKSGVSISVYNGNFLVKVPFKIKDSFKKAVKSARWQPETKEWFVSSTKESALREWVGA